MSLKDILANINCSDEDDVADEIENRIEILQNTVSYKVPLLIKPIFDIKDSDSSFISCMQAGAYNQVTRVMIEIGVPRECALELNKSLFQSYDCNNKTEEEIELEIRSILKTNKSTLPYWIGAQLNFLG